MRKEQEVLEEERQEIALRREEFQRELKEWEEGLETVSILRPNTDCRYKHTNTQIPKKYVKHPNSILPSLVLNQS